MDAVSISRQGPNLMVVDASGKASILPKAGNQWLVTKDEVSGGGGEGTGYEIGNIPATIRVPHFDGSMYTMDATQKKWAVEIIKAAAQYPGIDDRAVIACLSCAGVESVFRMYANSKIAESLSYPHDLVGSDGLSTGLYQQQYQYGWGTVKQIMTDIKYSTFSFLGGKHGPRGGNSPAGYFDIPGHQERDLGTVVQDVQGSAHPGRYRHTVRAGEIILKAVLKRYQGGGGSSGAGGVRIDPFPGKYDASDPFGGWGGGQRSMPHTGSDWNGIAEGTGCPAMAAGTVTHVGYTSWNGNCITVKMSHPNNRGLYYAYLHLSGRGNVNVGDRVNTGQILGPLGNTGRNSRGAHLHITLSGSPEAHNGIGPRYDPYHFIKTGELRG